MKQVNLHLFSTKNVSVPLSAIELNNLRVHVARVISKHAGGGFVTRSDGYYIADNGDLIIEKNYIVSTVTDDEKTIQYVKRLAKKLASLYKQESVLVRVHNVDVSFIG